MPSLRWVQVMVCLAALLYLVAAVAQELVPTTAGAFEGWGQLGAVGVALALLVYLITKTLPAKDKQLVDSMQLRDQAIKELVQEFKQELAADRKSHQTEMENLTNCHGRVVEALREVTTELRSHRAWDGKTERRRH